ncbi:agmatine deiminase [Candidatus Peregrinibacteria bacterium CG10_big_fil_rev_8_21_14_0_10_55_24]|nr:MAG: agmatine deiminase [Candidatus Peregrinibacteria bacterium CG10_big_fil_rev_8_21_14_0_10_55_24]
MSSLSPLIPGSPAAEGFRMPAEWEPHEATWLSWPHNHVTWGDHLEGAEATYVKIISALTPHETVHVLVANSAVHQRAQQQLSSIRNDQHLVFHDIDAGDTWFRDYGPIFLTREKPRHEIAWTKWIYNAYGNTYEDLLIGNDAPHKMPLDAWKRFDSGMVLEGGSIDVNGTGTLITTESCLLSPDRNPGMTKAQIEHTLKDFLGVTNILWLSAGIQGDDTTGHVDDITRFVNQNTVVTVTEKDPQDANYVPLAENLKRLKSMSDERGEPITVIEMPMPRPFFVKGRRMAASYANFYIANGIVLVPTYNQESDEIALATLRKCFPDRNAMGIDCRELIWGFGAIHCVTQQQPQGIALGT